MHVILSLQVHHEVRRQMHRHGARHDGKWLMAAQQPLVAKHRMLASNTIKIIEHSMFSMKPLTKVK